MINKISILFFILLLNLYANELRISTNSNALEDQLNPHQYSPNEMWAQNIVYDGLVDFKDGKVVPALATSWDIKNDGLTYIFHLRKNVKFSNNDSFNADVVKKNFDAILANKINHMWLELVDNIKDYKVIDPLTFELDLKKPYNLTLKELALVRPFRFISPSAFINNGTKDGIKASIGTGRYKLVKSIPGVLDEFKENENYWGKKSDIKTIVAKVIPDESAKILALKNKNIDLIYGNDQLSLRNFNKFKNEFSYAISKPYKTLALILNSSKAPTNSLNIRKALSYAVNKKEIRNALFGQEKVATYLFDIDLNASKFDFNQTKAKDLLSNYKLENGFFYKDNKKLEVNFVYEAKDQFSIKLAKILKDEFAQVGIALNLIPCEESIYVKRVKNGEFNIALMSTWGDPYGIKGFISSFRHKSHADFIAQSGLKIKKDIDKNLTNMLFVPNSKKDYKDLVLQSLTNEAIYIPLVYESNRALFNKNLKNVKIDKSEYDILFNEFKLDK